MQYLYQHTNGDQMIGLFDSLQAAYDDALREAIGDGERYDYEIYDTRPATPDDRELFDGAEGMEDTDFAKDGWWTKLVVPQNVVLTCTLG